MEYKTKNSKHESTWKALFPLGAHKTLIKKFKEYYNIEIKAKISYGDSNGSAPGSDIDTEFDTEGKRNGGDGPSTGDDNPKKLAFLL